MTAACIAVGLPLATFYRHTGSTQPSAIRPSPRGSHRALKAAERAQVLAVLNSERFMDKAPAEVFATLLDEGTFLCSERTMYRILAAEQAVRERRNQRRHPDYKKPELLAAGPNQVWSWDITKLKGPAKWTYFYLYVIIDIFSRYVVGWMVAPRESASLAKQLIDATCEKQDIGEGQLIIHSDRGAAMTSKAVAQLMADLAVIKSHSRPYVSDDNPFSESQFKTLKYRPEFPSNFGCIEDALAFCRQFFPWYNDEHHHSGISHLTPSDLHYGRADAILDLRHLVMLKAYTANPERFVNGPPARTPTPSVVWINPPSTTEATLQ